MQFGITPYYLAFPGTLSLKAATYMAVVRDLLDSLYKTGFRRVLIVNGHGGNSPAMPVTMEWMGDHPGTRVRFHNWWNAPKTWAKVQEIDPVASHASWMENFPGPGSRASICRRSGSPWSTCRRSRTADPSRCGR